MAILISTRSVRISQRCSVSSLLSDFLVLWLKFSDHVRHADYVMAQTSRAVIPKDPGGPFASRIGVTVGGPLSWALRVGAYRTGRTSSQLDRYTIVVLNWWAQFPHNHLCLVLDTAVSACRCS